MNPDPEKRYHDVNDLRLALAERKPNNIYIAIIAFLVAMIAFLLWLNSPYRPTPLSETTSSVTTESTN